MDLRFMTPQVHQEFLAIVLGGSRTEKGMASFADVLTREEAEDIHHYLISRANEDWGTGLNEGVEAGVVPPQE